VAEQAEQGLVGVLDPDVAPPHLERDIDVRAGGRSGLLGLEDAHKAPGCSVREGMAVTGATLLRRCAGRRWLAAGWKPAHGRPVRGVERRTLVVRALTPIAGGAAPCRVGDPVLLRMDNRCSASTQVAPRSTNLSERGAPRHTWFAACKLRCARGSRAARRGS